MDVHYLLIALIPLKPFTFCHVTATNLMGFYMDFLGQTTQRRLTKLYLETFTKAYTALLKSTLDFLVVM